MYKKYIIANEGELKETIEFSLVNIENEEETKDWSGDKLASYSFVEKNLKSLTGRILTIIDASIPSGTQNKCVKDLIRREFINEFEHISSMMFDQSTIERALEGLNVDNVQLCSAEEILGK